MPYLTQLAVVARRTGYPVTEVAGWRSRGHEAQPEVQGIVCHHTAGRDDMHVVRDGRPGLDGPLSHFWLRRDGRIFVVAAGRCWHNAPSTSPYHDNSSSLGIEAENNGREPWPAKQLDAYRKLCAELCKTFRLPASRVRGHKEVNRQKPDPHSINMSSFRAEVARLIAGEDDMEPTTSVKISPYWRDPSRNQFSHDAYPAGFLWAGAVAETRIYGKAILAQLQAQQATIDRLVDALSATQPDLDALKAEIREAIESVQVRLDVDEEVNPT